MLPTVLDQQERESIADGMTQHCCKSLGPIWMERAYQAPKNYDRPMHQDLVWQLTKPLAAAAANARRVYSSVT